jgi:hypothetical protein
VGLDGVVPVDLPRREPLEDLVECGAAFEAGEMAAQAEVNAIPEREVVIDRAVNVETVRVGKCRSSRFPAPVRNTSRTLGNRLAVVLDVARDIPLVPATAPRTEGAFDRVGDQAVFDELLALVVG